MAYQHSHSGYSTRDSQESQQMHHFVGTMSQNSSVGMDEIDPSLLDLNYQQHNYVYQQSYPAPEQQQPLQRFIGESDQMGPLRNAHMYQRSMSNAVASVPRASTRMDSPTPSMYSHGITVTSSANSPVDENELMYDPAMYSPNTSYGFPTYPEQSHSGKHFLHDLDLGLGVESAIPQYALPPTAFDRSCVNMSEVQNYADYGLDEGYSMQGGGGNDFIEVDHSGVKAEGGNSYHYIGDEGLGSSIQDESSQHTPATPLTATDDFHADADLDDISATASPASDTDYSPKSKASRGNGIRRAKRSRESYDPASTIRVSNKRARITKSVSSPNMRMSVQSYKADSTNCPTCAESFTSPTLLAKHVSKEHTKAFVCVFSFAGCPSVFATKNEWKRHVYSQHCNFNTWTCDIGDCDKPHGKGKNASGSAAGANGVSAGAHFNRKDLYTQHLRRMHTPRGVEKGGKTSAVAIAWDERIRSLQETNCHQTRHMPDELNCPLASCGVQFSGKNCWDERMEHVGKHLEGLAQARGAAAASGKGMGAAKHSKMIEEFDQGDDDLLVEWAITEGIVTLAPGGEGYCFVGDVSKRRVDVQARHKGRGNGNGNVQGSDDDAEGEDDD